MSGKTIPGASFTGFTVTTTESVTVYSPSSAVKVKLATPLESADNDNMILLFSSIFTDKRFALSFV